jgi:hypothetical protein
MAADFDPEQVIQQVTENLRKRFPDIKDSEVEKAATLAVRELADRPVQDYVSVLAERAAKNQLRKAHPTSERGKKGSRK